MFKIKKNIERYFLLTLLLFILFFNCSADSLLLNENPIKESEEESLENNTNNNLDIPEGKLRADLSSKYYYWKLKDAYFDHIKGYSVGKNNYLFCLEEKPSYNATTKISRYNVKIMQLREKKLYYTHKYKWTGNWDSVDLVSNTSGGTYLLIYKSMGWGSDGNNLHIYRMNSNGSVGKKVYSVKANSGWKEVKFHNLNGYVYVTFLSNGYHFLQEGNSRYMSYKFDIKSGKIGKLINDYKFKKGFSNVLCYEVSNKFEAIFYNRSDNNIYNILIYDIDYKSGKIKKFRSRYKIDKYISDLIIYEGENPSFKKLLVMSQSRLESGNYSDLYHLYPYYNETTKFKLVKSYSWFNGALNKMTRLDKYIFFYADPFNPGIKNLMMRELVN